MFRLLCYTFSKVYGDFMKKIIIVISIIFLMFSIGFIFVINTDSFKRFFITSAMSSMNHQYLAYILYDEDTINEVMMSNYVEEVDENIKLDKIKIGKFICDTRKESGMTQLELAQKIGVTDRAVSKWENGRGLPDISLIKPLCDALSITINELFNVC